MDDSARRVRLSTAITAARAALAVPVPDEPEDPATQPLAAVPAPRNGADPLWTDEHSPPAGEQSPWTGEPSPPAGEQSPWTGDQAPGAAAPRGPRRGRRRLPRGSVAPARRPGEPAPGRAAPAGSRRPATSPQGLFRGAARSLFVTPWFAAATGFVIAAGLWVYSPHTVLRFPNSEPGVSVCKSAGCVPASNPNGDLTVVSPGQQIHGTKAKKTGDPAKAEVGRGSKAAAGLVFKFTVRWQRHHGFGATITVTGHKVPDSWWLSFDLPGTQIEDVRGVTWQPNSDGDGGTASQASWQSGNSVGSNGSDDSGAFGGGTDKLPVITFLVTGNGPATAPVHCDFDGATCTFR